MIRMPRLLLVTAFLFTSTLLVYAQTPKLNDSLIVTTDWLAKHLNDETLVLLQVGEKDEYMSSHIPRAQFIQLADISTPRGQGLTLELPTLDQLKATFEKLGVSDNSRIVIYFGKDWVTPTARVFMTLDYLGFGDRTSILDGGLPAWRAEGKLVTADLVESKKGSLTHIQIANSSSTPHGSKTISTSRTYESSTPVPLSSTREPNRAACLVGDIFHTRRTFRSRAWLRTQTTSSSRRSHCEIYSTLRM